MERKEPTFSPSANSQPERDEAAIRRTVPPAPEPRPARPSSSYTPPSRPVSSAPSSSSPVALIALVVALAASAGSGFLGWKLVGTQESLARADSRIAELEGRLNVSSDESSQSLTQVDAKLKWVDSEIRKLWGISNDTNRKAIAANTEKIAGLTKDLGAIKTDAAAAKKDATEARNAANALRPELTASKTAVESSVAKLDTAVKSIEDQRKRLQDLTEQLDRTDAQLASLRAIEGKVRTSEEAIAAIDANRRTLNSDILRIKQQLGIN